MPYAAHDHAGSSVALSSAPPYGEPVGTGVVLTGVGDATVLISKTVLAMVPVGVGPFSCSEAVAPGATEIWPPVASPMMLPFASYSDARAVIVWAEAACDWTLRWMTRAPLASSW